MNKGLVTELICKAEVFAIEAVSRAVIICSSSGNPLFSPLDVARQITDAVRSQLVLGALEADPKLLRHSRYASGVALALSDMGIPYSEIGKMFIASSLPHDVNDRAIAMAIREASGGQSGGYWIVQTYIQGAGNYQTRYEKLSLTEDRDHRDLRVQLGRTAQHGTFFSEKTARAAAYLYRQYTGEK